tara:strand:+ start:1446 stop:1586 length:141 start_codon:yes stop_codon:yes gene_type:complete
MLGMMIETYEDKPIPTEAYFMLLFSPIVLPVLIGMIITEKCKRDDK